MENTDLTQKFTQRLKADLQRHKSQMGFFCLCVLVGTIASRTDLRLVVELTLIAMSAAFAFVTFGAFSAVKAAEVHNNPSSQVSPKALSALNKTAAAFLMIPALIIVAVIAARLLS